MDTVASTRGTSTRDTVNRGTTLNAQPEQWSTVGRLLSVCTAARRTIPRGNPCRDGRGLGLRSTRNELHRNPLGTPGQNRRRAGCYARVTPCGHHERRGPSAALAHVAARAATPPPGTRRRRTVKRCRLAAGPPRPRPPPPRPRRDVGPGGRPAPGTRSDGSDASRASTTTSPRRSGPTSSTRGPDAPTAVRRARPFSATASCPCREAVATRWRTWSPRAPPATRASTTARSPGGCGARNSTSARSWSGTRRSCGPCEPTSSASPVG
ncbi:hypothetical protein GJR88_04322 [Dietzia sp. DQ12-45-1b]|nr:hypothetical protein GJR88_04322 [Dietzia sp. DQ12-45-1b]